MRLRRFACALGLTVLGACGGSPPAQGTGGQQVFEVKAGEGQLVLSADDVQHLEVVKAPEGYRLRVELRPAASRNLAQLTRANVGRKIPIVIHGEVVMDPLVRDPIVTGRLEISAKDQSDLERLQRLLQ